MVEVEKEDMIKIIEMLNEAGDIIMGEWYSDGGYWDFADYIADKYRIKVEEK